MPIRPEDIELDQADRLSDDDHEDIAYEQGYLTEDEYEATGAWGPLIGEEEFDEEDE